MRSPATVGATYPGPASRAWKRGAPVVARNATRAEPAFAFSTSQTVSPATVGEPLKSPFPTFRLQPTWARHLPSTFTRTSRPGVATYSAPVRGE